MIALGLLLAACSSATPQPEPPSPAVDPPTEEPSPAPVVEPTPVPTEGPTPVPEPTVEFSYMNISVLEGSPQDTAEGTFELYLRDAIHMTERRQQERLELRSHYEDPSILEQDFGGMVVEVNLIEDRSTVRNASETNAIVDGDFDVQVTFADDETDFRVCAWEVNLELLDGTWYVINPTELPIFSVCTS
jgi:hypothetical protein